MPQVRNSSCKNFKIDLTMTINMQICWLFIVVMPIACIAWTVTHEEVFREPRKYFVKRSLHGKTLLEESFSICLHASTALATT